MLDTIVDLQEDIVKFTQEIIKNLNVDLLVVSPGSVRFYFTDSD